ncbi:hypothetical protein MNO14_08225 [Luteimonas sp. S4-F44]|uniref:hypothetical protein n=1 Tax=Luteimonas sp. S4-F44 TaxID=2925842 RepID=UPI001F532829|nr:hypothetical protein [Luteimonas sp. S4-F44]UNK44020.1 hypothetical protein MNO14_08225 [Luteimonas sp. S4-F44]
MADGACFIQARPAVAVLFARCDSVYKSDPRCDVYDIDRDARTWLGGMPVVAHPPCRSWSRMRTFAKPRPGERDLAVWAIDQVRRFGGVLEHPSGSALFRELALPRPGSTDRDSFGGWVMPVSQKWWGHRAEKRTWLYIVGADPSSIPAFPLSLGEAERVCGLWSGRDRSRARKEIGPAEREHTPPALALWLVDLAASTAVDSIQAVRHG